MLGHGSTKITTQYGKVVDEKLSKEMNELKEKLRASSS